MLTKKWLERMKAGGDERGLFGITAEDVDELIDLALEALEKRESDDGAVTVEGFAAASIFRDNYWSRDIVSLLRVAPTADEDRPIPVTATIRKREVDS